MNKKRAVKTEVRSNTRHPVWNDDLKMLVHEPETQSLTVELRDWDLTVSDRIGRRAFQYSLRGPLFVFVSPKASCTPSSKRAHAPPFLKLLQYEKLMGNCPLRRSV